MFDSTRSVRLVLCLLALAAVLSAPAGAGAPAGDAPRQGFGAAEPGRRPGDQLLISRPSILRLSATSRVSRLGLGRVPDQQSTSSAGWETIFSDDFEGAFPGSWLVGDTNPEGGEYHWGQRQCRAYSGLYSAWIAGGGADGSALACGSTYPDNMESWLVYGPFSLEDATAAELTWKLWLDTEPEYDNLWWGVSTDGEQFVATGASGDSQGWIDWTFDLNDVPDIGTVLGQPQVWVALIFVSDADINVAEGCYVDDVVLSRNVGGAAQYGAYLPSVMKQARVLPGS